MPAVAHVDGVGVGRREGGSDTPKLLNGVGLRDPAVGLGVRVGVGDVTAACSCTLHPAGATTNHLRRVCSAEVDTQPRPGCPPGTSSVMLSLCVLTGHGVNDGVGVGDGMVMEADTVKVMCPVVNPRRTRTRVAVGDAGK